MIKPVWIILVFIIMSSLNAQEIPKDGVQERLVWPKGGIDDARIEYIKSVNSASSLGIKKGFFSKVYDFIFGENETKLSAPFGIHANLERVYVTDISAKAVFIFDKKENETIILEGSDNERFSYPIDVVADAKGNIYVSDSEAGKIFVFDKDGDFSHFITLKVIQRPIGIAISADGKLLYIVDVVAGAIHVSTLDGKFVKTFGKMGKGELEFNKPTYIDVASNGDIYVADSMNHRIEVLDKDGKFIRVFGRLSQTIGGFANPRGIALDSDDNVYVSDTMYNTIQIFNKHGEILMKFGSYGGGRGEFALVEDISIIEGNTIYVADVNNRAVKIFKRLDPKE